MNNPEARDRLAPLFLKLPPENIVRLKFTIESYEGLGVVRTLDRERGEIVILALADTIEVVEAVVSELEEELRVQRVPPPDDLSNDWWASESLASHDLGKDR